MAIFPSSSGMLAIASLATIVLTAAITLHRLFFSPLAKIPGPKLAALTGWYEAYFDCFKAGRYWVEIEDMHKKYGPIVRISPWEVHVDDPEWIEPYKISAKVNKYLWFYKFVGRTGSAFSTTDHDLHRIRRKSQQAHFTQDAVVQFEPDLRSLVSKLTTRMEEFKGTGQPVNLSNAYRSMATDVVTEYCFHKSYDLLDAPDFAASFHKAIRDSSRLGIWHRQFGLVLDILTGMPRWLVAMMNPAALSVLNLFGDITSRTNAAVADYKRSEMTESNPHIIHRMLDSPDLPAEEKVAWHLALQARSFVVAGTETTGNALSVITYHLLTNPEKVERLKNEIKAAEKIAGIPLTNQQLQELPYLGFGVCGRLPRVNTRESLQYKEYTIPIGTPVSTTSKLTHDNSAIFPSPRTFIPERWLDHEERKRLEKYLQPFGRGSRACIGLNLAYAEIYFAVANVIGKYDMRLFETGIEDIEQAHDFFSPWPVTERGLRVIVE